MAKRKSAREQRKPVLLKVYLSEPLHRRLQMHALAARQKMGETVAELVERYVPDYDRIFAQRKSLDDRP